MSKKRSTPVRSTQVSINMPMLSVVATNIFKVDEVTYKLIFNSKAINRSIRLCYTECKTITATSSIIAIYVSLLRASSRDWIFGIDAIISLIFINAVAILAVYCTAYFKSSTLISCWISDVVPATLPQPIQQLHHYAFIHNLLKSWIYLREA